MEALNQLTPDERAVLLNAPVWATVLVGAADGKLDSEERFWSEKMVRARSYAGRNELHEYYQQVDEHFNDKLNAELNQLPAGVAERQAVLSSKLEQLNAILPKLNPEIAYSLYKGLLGLAKETAKASGGFLRIGAISASQYEWVKLPMIHAVAKPAHYHENEPDDPDENIWGGKED